MTKKSVGDLEVLKSILTENDEILIQDGQKYFQMVEDMIRGLVQNCHSKATYCFFRQVPSMNSNFDPIFCCFKNLIFLRVEPELAL